MYYAIRDLLNSESKDTSVDNRCSKSVQTVTDDAAGRKAQFVNSSDHKLGPDIEKTHCMSSTAIQQCMLSDTSEACYFTQTMLLSAAPEWTAQQRQDRGLQSHPLLQPCDHLSEE